MTTHISQPTDFLKTNRRENKKLATSIDIQGIVKLAAQSIAPVWPLKTFIACNALQGFESRPFEEALTEAAVLFEEKRLDYEPINRETIKWCTAYFDEGQSTIEMPSREKGFYPAFKELSIYDKMLHQGSKKNKQWLLQLPSRAEEAIVHCFEILRISDEEQLSFLKKSLAQLSGWSGYIKWRTEWQHSEALSTKKANLLVDFLAIRLIITVLLNPEIHFAKGNNILTKDLKNPIIQTIKKLEEDYKAGLIPPLLEQASRLNKHDKKAADVQLVFCIDVRSEPFRRQLESLGSYETFGFAGFFGLPIRLHDYNSGKVTDSCPVLLKPQYDIQDKPTDQDSKTCKQHAEGKKLLEGLTDIYQQLKYNFATPFALVETLGAWSGLLMLSKTIKPVSTVSTIKQWFEKIKPTVNTKPLVDKATQDNNFGIPESEQAVYAETVLRIMGLTEHFAKYIIFCGHGSSTENNPYASGLDCGACGGNHGGGNAKVLAAILNKKSVRNRLSERGIEIPKDSYFLAAEHNTTRDDLIIFEDPTKPTSQDTILCELQTALKKAKENNTASRANDFDTRGQINPVEETRRRSQDWSEVRPEWGLAGNAAFIVGPRQLSKDLNLEGRCFLHSYEWEKDESESALETILTAPMVVAEWINSQYLFSTINNVIYGSGSKVTHNVTGKIGVMQGNGSDLMHGLPLQSVNSTDSKNFHQPQRLLSVIYAPRKRVTAIIERQAILRTLFFNAWVHLIVIEPTENKAYQLQSNGDWSLIDRLNQ